MLTELRIANFAVIEQLSLQFHEGFTVLTGETGAGKSLLIDAIALLLGGRASIDQIRTGEEEAQLEAAFSFPSEHPLLARLRAQGVLRSSERDLIIRRVLSRSGRHRAYLNGVLSPVHAIEELGGTLVDIHGQHDQQSLLSSLAQLDALDAYAGLEESRARYEQRYFEWKERIRQLDESRRLIREHAQREELLRFQLQEILDAQIQQGEEDRLSAEHTRLAHAHRLGELAHEVYVGLTGDEHGALSTMGRVCRLLSELRHIDPDCGETAQVAEEAAVQLKELAGRVRGYVGSLEADPRRLATVEQRLDVLHRLAKKYGGSADAVIERGRQLQEQLDAVENDENRVAELERQAAEVFRQTSELAALLSRKRMEAAKRLRREVTEELSALKMDRAKFDILVEADAAIEALGSSGRDRVEFHVTTNPGEPPKPLSRVVSGGELSRIMLALKTILAERDRVPVLIFDEVDAGVGGAVAAAMGKRLRALSAFHQVFCITHLPQIASQAQHHLLVEKRQEKNRTATSVKRLVDSGREEEIARMLGGLTITKKIRETAAEMMTAAKPRR